MQPVHHSRDKSGPALERNHGVTPFLEEWIGAEIHSQFALNPRYCASLVRFPDGQGSLGTIPLPRASPIADNVGGEPWDIQRDWRSFSPSWLRQSYLPAPT